MSDDSLNQDQRWVEEALAGKVESFEMLVRRHQDRLFNTMVCVTGCVHEAEEVVQDAMLQAYAKLPTFQGKSQFYTWLYRIAFNLSISRNRKRRPRVSLEQIQNEHGVDPLDEGERPDDSMLRSERAEQLYQALNQLSEEYRSVLVLRELEDFDYETISGMLDIPVGTVRSRLHRARTMLRDQLRESIGEPGPASS